MIRKDELTKREWLLLSAYLDGELSGRERRQVEELLQSNPAGREALEALRRTRQVLRFAPVHKVPRNFTLSPDMVAKPLLPSFSKVLSFSSALAGILLVIVFGLDVSTRSMPVQEEQLLRTTVEEPQAMLAEENIAEDSEATPEIINWGLPSSDTGAYGVGGGGDEKGGFGTGMGGGAVVEEEAVEAEAAPVEGAVESEESLAQEDKGSGALILGVQPEEERGEIITERPALPEQVVQQQEFPWRLVEWILAVLVLLTGLGALAFRRRR